VLATDTWAHSPEEPQEGHCVDTWTLAPVTVPVAGLTPYPADVTSQPDWAAQVVVTPVALLTLGDTSNATVAEKYNKAFESLGISTQGGAYGDGMVNSDPMVLLASKDPAKISTAVAMLAASAKVLNTLSVARALYEGREGSNARLSNELFQQWAQALVKPEILNSADKLTATFSELCLVNCASDASASLATISKQLDDIAVSRSLLGGGAIRGPSTYLRERAKTITSTLV